MPENNPDSYYSDLILKYLSGNADSSETQELEAWVLEHPDHKAEFVALKKSWMLTGMQQETRTVDVEQLWQQTATQIKAAPAPAPAPKIVALKPRRRPWVAIAASIALLLSVGLWLLSGTADFERQTTAASSAFALPDGSAIVLNQSSSLRYTKNEETSQREVELQGDAFFDIAKDPEAPFVILTDQLEIEVTGTSFYVDARNNQEEIQVIVAEGSVEVRYGQEIQPLVAGDKAIFRKNEKKLVKIENTDANFTSLKTGELHFDNSPLEEVVFALNRQFNANLILEITDLSNCKLDGDHVNQSLKTILASIEGALGVSIEEKDSAIVLSGANCP